MNNQHSLPVLPTEIGGQPVRYPEYRRWTMNNGFRQQWLNVGERNAAAINAARRGDKAAVAEHIATLGGVHQPKTLLRSALKVAAKLTGDVPGYKIVDGTVVTPHLTWRWSGRRQAAVIEWRPMWGGK